jgi:hypothetical protein
MIRIAGAPSVRSTHRWSVEAACFDEQSLVSCAGLAPGWLLAEQTGLRRLLGRVRFSGLEGSIRGGEPGREAGVRDRWDERRSGLH